MGKTYISDIVDNVDNADNADVYVDVMVKANVTVDLPKCGSVWKHRIGVKCGH